jgi:hypothetical protein
MIDIGFQWSRARTYECADVGGSRVIRPSGEKRDKLEPFKINGAKPLYIRFAELDGSDEACRQFACAWGLLTTDEAGKAETVAGWQKEIRKLRGLMNSLRVGEKPPGGFLRAKTGSRGHELRLTSIRVSLVPGTFDADGVIGRPQMMLEPETLLDAMYLQLGKFVAGDGTLSACKQCGGWFERGATESRRSIAVFCSEKCKNRFHYLERAKR